VDVGGGGVIPEQRTKIYLHDNLNFRPNYYWTMTWGVVAPLVMAIIFLFYCFQWEPVKYGHVEFPSWAHVIGKQIKYKLSSLLDAHPS
jgi:hypothetical protein